MKTSTKPMSEDSFKPFTLELTIESEEEVQELYALFNTAIITNMMPHVPDISIRDALRDGYPGCPSGKHYYGRLRDYFMRPEP